MSAILRDQWQIVCDECGVETKAGYESVKLADMCVMFWGWQSDAEEMDDVTENTRHVCRECKAKETT